jgi:hypothetical protein
MQYKMKERSNELKKTTERRVENREKEKRRVGNVYRKTEVKDNVLLKVNKGGGGCIRPIRTN